MTSGKHQEGAFLGPKTPEPDFLKTLIKSLSLKIKCIQNGTDPDFKSVSAFVIHVYYWAFEEEYKNPPSNKLYQNIENKGVVFNFEKYGDRKKRAFVAWYLIMLIPPSCPMESEINLIFTKFKIPPFCDMNPTSPMLAHLRSAALDYHNSNKSQIPDELTTGVNWMLDLWIVKIIRIPEMLSLSFVMAMLVKPEDVFGK